MTLEWKRTRMQSNFTWESPSLRFHSDLNLIWTQTGLIFNQSSTSFQYRSSCESISEQNWPDFHFNLQRMWPSDPAKVECNGIACWGLKHPGKFRTCSPVQILNFCTCSPVQLSCSPVQFLQSTHALPSIYDTNRKPMKQQTFGDNHLNYFELCSYCSELVRRVQNCLRKGDWQHE